MHLSSHLTPSLLALALLVLGPAAVATTTRPVSVPGALSPVFSLRINGIAVPVLAYKDIHYAQAHCAGQATVEVSLQSAQAVGTASIHPLQFGIQPSIEGPRAQFVLPQPGKLVIQIDYLPKLFLFLESADADAPPAGTDPIVDAVKAGAKPDGVTDSTEAVQRAIDGLPKGGTLFFPPGHYRTGSLRMRSGTTLHLAGGALLQAVDQHERITPFPASPDMIAYLQACDVSDFTLSGLGAVDANGYVVRLAYQAAENIRKKPGRALAFANCRNIRVRGITVRDSYSWNVHSFLSDHLEFRNVKILSDVRLSNHDGFDIDRCNDVLVEDCFIFSEDDALSPKARPGRAVVENLTFRNCTLWVHKANGIRVGSESDCEVMRNLLFENIHILTAADGIRLDCFQGARFENMTFRNVWIEQFLEHYDPGFERNRERTSEHASRSISLTVTCQGGNRPPGQIRGVLFDNVNWSDPRVPMRLEVSEVAKKRAAESGPGARIENIVFRNCRQAGRLLGSAEDAGLRVGEPYVTGIRFETDESAR